MSSRPVLSPVGARILVLLAEGLPAPAIANQLETCEQEIEREISDMLRSLGLNSRVELILFAYSRTTSKAE